MWGWKEGNFDYFTKLSIPDETIFLVVSGLVCINLHVVSITNYFSLLILPLRSLLPSHKEQSCNSCVRVKETVQHMMVECDRYELLLNWMTWWKSFSLLTEAFAVVIQRLFLLITILMTLKYQNLPSVSIKKLGWC